MTYRLLLVEDDAQITETIVDFFSAQSEGICTIETAADGTEGLHMALSGGFDLILLDVMLPGLDGFSICRSIRAASDVPLLFLTARAREEDVLYGYTLGCDDRLVCGAITVDTRRLICTVDGTELDLPPKQFAILLYLMRHPGWTVSRETLLDRVWGMDYFGSDRVVDTHIKKLRKALGAAGKQIRTVISRGYQLTEKG